MNPDQISILSVTADNISEAGVFCIRNKKAAGYKAKVDWFKDKLNEGLTIKIAIDQDGKQLGFIEYLPSEKAWRPVKADNFLFIQCIGVFVKEARRQNLGATLIEVCEEDARKQGKSGICTMSSDGAWMANKSLFVKNGFQLAEKKGRFELMYKSFNGSSQLPGFHDWVAKQKEYSGWNLVYADQCPWHEKSVKDLKESAKKNGIDLKIRKLNTPEEAQNAPSGFGTFSLIKDGILLEDHYLSRTRFESILKKEMT